MVRAWADLCISIRAASVFTIMVKAPTRAFSWWKAPTSTSTAFTFNVKLGHRHKGHMIIR